MEVHGGMLRGAWGDAWRWMGVCLEVEAGRSRLEVPLGPSSWIRGRCAPSPALTWMNSSVRMRQQKERLVRPQAPLSMKGSSGCQPGCHSE